MKLMEDGLTLEVTERHIYEEAVACYKTLNKQFGVVVDIGANAGSLSLLAASDGCRKVIAVEPFRVDRLVENIKANSLFGPITYLPMALASTNGWANLRQITNDAMVGPAYLEARAMPLHPVLCITPQQVLDIAGGAVDLLKIDIEGGEWQMLRDRSLVPLLSASWYVNMELHPEGEFFPPGVTKGVELETLMRECGLHCVQADGPRQTLWKRK